MDLEGLWRDEDAAHPGPALGTAGIASEKRAAPGFSCRFSLTSLSLSATSISSEALPRLALACPALAHIRVSRCPRLTGCSVLAATRLRGTQIQAAATAAAAVARARSAASPDPHAAIATAAPAGSRSATAGLSLDSAASTSSAAIDPRVTRACAASGAAVTALHAGSGNEASAQPAAWRTLAAAELGGWDEDPAAVLGEILVAQLAERASRVRGFPVNGSDVRSGMREEEVAGDGSRAADVAGGLAAGLAAGAAAGRDAPPPPALGAQRQQERGGQEHAAAVVTSAARRMPEMLTAEALGCGGMLEELFEAAGGCGLATCDLTALDLSGTSQFSDMAAARLACCSPGLASLSLASCSRLTDEGLGHLASLTRLTALDLTGCAPGPGASQAATPGSAFRRPSNAAAERGPGGWGASAVAAAGAAKRARRTGVTDSGLASLVTELQSAQASTVAGIGGALVGPQRTAEAGDGTFVDSVQQTALGSSGMGNSATNAVAAAPRLVSLCLGGTEAGDATLRAASGLTRLELQGCRNATDWAVLQAMERCPQLLALKLSGCSQLSPAALGCSMLHQHQRATSATAPASGAAGSSEPLTPAASNTRARALRRVSLPGALASDAFLSWLLETDIAAVPLSASGSEATPRLIPADRGGHLGFSAKADPFAPVLPSSPLWALQSLDLGPAPGNAAASSSRAAASGAVAAVAGGVSDALLTRLPGSCPLLHSLRLRGAVRVSDAGAAAVLRGCPLLRRFALTGSPLVTDATLGLALALAADRPAGRKPACGTIYYMLAADGGAEGSAKGADASGNGRQIGSQHRIEGAEPADVGLHGGSLLHLDLSGCVAVTGGCVAPAPLLASGSGGCATTSDHGGRADAEIARPPGGTGLMLLSLSLGGCRQLSSGALAALLPRCPHLRELELPLSAAALRVAAECCPSLRTLKVTEAQAAAATTGRAGAHASSMRGGHGAVAGAGESWPLALLPGVEGLGRPVGQLGTVDTAVSAGSCAWPALTRLEVPASRRGHGGLRSWLSSRPDLHAWYT